MQVVKLLPNTLYLLTEKRKWGNGREVCLNQTTGLDQQKLVEIILYIGNRIKNPTILKICKILYFADLDHLQRFGRFISRDNYVAMKHGPVPSMSYNILKEARKFGTYNEDFKIQDAKKLALIREADLDEFSESDVESLDYAINKFGKCSVGNLVDISHDQAWNKVTKSGQIFDDDSAPNMMPLALESIIEMMPNSEELRLHLIREGVI